MSNYPTVTQINSTSSAFVGNVWFTAGITDSTGTEGTAGQVLTTNGAGNVYWSTVSGGGSINTSAQYTFTNTITFTMTINGTSNSTLFVGSVSAANVVSNAQLQANLGNYYLNTNPSGYVNSTSGTANNSTNFAGLSLTTVQGYITGNAATAYNNAVAYAASVGVNTAARYTWTNTQTFNANVVIAGNSTSVLLVGNNSTTTNVQVGGLTTAGTPTALSGSGSSNSSIDIVIFNTNASSNASSDFAAYDNNGLSSNNFIDMGISSSGYSNTSWTINGPSDGYLYTGNTNLSIGTASYGGGANYINFFTGGTLAANEKMRIGTSSITFGLSTSPIPIVFNGVLQPLSLPSATPTVANGNFTPSANTNQYNMYLNGAANVAPPAGTPVDGQKLMLRFKDNGSGPYTITMNTSSTGYRPVSVALPTTTVSGKVLYIGCIYNGQDTFWDVVAVAEQ